MKGKLNYFAPLVLLHILTQQVALCHSTSVCMHHLGCYRDNSLHLSHVTNYYSHHTSRTAENCIKLCLQREPSTEVVLVKVARIDDLLMCGCGGHEALGNGTGLTFDLLGCYLCPDSLREKCGSELMSSAYQIGRYSREPCKRVLVVPPAVTTTATTTTTTTTTATTTSTRPPVAFLTAKPASKGEISLPDHSDRSKTGYESSNPNYPANTYNSVDNGPYYPKSSSGDANYLSNKPSLPNHREAASNNTNELSIPNYHSDEANFPTVLVPDLNYLGCYDEDNVNQSLVVTMVVSSGSISSYGGYGVSNCNSNCTRSYPASKVLLVKVLSADTVYCGCGMLAALPSSGHFKHDTTTSGTSSTSKQCVMRCGRGRTSLPCGGWTSVSVYERNGQGSLSLSLSLYSLSLFLFLSLIFD